MLKILSLQKEKRKGGPKTAKVTSAQLRVQKDVSELGDFGGTIKAVWPDPENLQHFTLEITPDEGMYQGGTFKFTFDIPDNYPHKEPKVKCTQKIYHPNIDLDGNVCLNILREDWKPVLNLNSVFVGLQYLFLEPNADDPLNKDAAKDLRENREKFIRNVKASMVGRDIGNVQYDDVRVKDV
ncbi:ubiquitin-conjugating enzyme/RWD-like protein [Phellopilus nigrolimitatus]|nr:ubiquitin-conjugating enzyme/RWD-like protein [Phellopilus nigrolimitatus]